jgi:hypothetical protein
MNVCMSDRPSRPLHRDLVVYVLPLFLWFPQQPSAPDEAQDPGHRDVKVVTWFNKALTQVTQSGTSQSLALTQDTCGCFLVVLPPICLGQVLNHWFIPVFG